MVIKWSQDLSRTIDYLETRDDMDVNKLSTMGNSLGAILLSSAPAIENRIKVTVLIAGGYSAGDNPPEVSVLTFVRRVTTPVLTINGRYDYLFPVETAQKPFFDLFGTAPEDRRHILLNAGHGGLPRTEIINETLSWLDKYLGPVKTTAK